MSNKERIDYLLTKVSEDKREAFVEDLKAAANLDSSLAVLKKYGVSLTEEEMKKLTEKRELSDEELDATSGGCETCDNCPKQTCTGLCNSYD